MSHVSTHGFVRFSNCVINLAHVLYAYVPSTTTTSSRGTARYTFEIKFIETSRDLRWTRDTKQECEDLLQQFEQLLQTYVIPELP